MTDDNIFERHDYKQEVIRNMINGCTMKLHKLQHELMEVEECLDEVQYMMKEQEHHCNCCNKQEEETKQHWTSNNRRNTYKRW